MAETVKRQERAAKAAPREKKQGGGATLRIKQIGSLIGCTDRQRATVRGLGLRRMHHVVVRQDTPEIRGMVKAVPHLVTVVE